MQVKTANGENKIVMSRQEWEAIGKKAGWEDDLQGATGDLKQEVMDIQEKVRRVITKVVVQINEDDPSIVGLSWAEKLSANDRLREVSDSSHRIENEFTQILKEIY